MTPWNGLREAWRGTAMEPFADGLVKASAAEMDGSRHGDLSRWLRALASLPATRRRADLDQPAPSLGATGDDQDGLASLLMEFHPWRKGPLCLGGVEIDSEWRSNLKWERISPHINLTDKHVLDVGCGNGYFGWRMLGAGARSITGIDPTQLFVMQWLAQAHFAPGLNQVVLPFRDVDLPTGLGGFDAVFSMGVLYHRRNPAAHLDSLYTWLKPGGELVLETLVLDREGRDCLVPEGRYARMRNVWHIPTPASLVAEMAEQGFMDIRVLDVTVTTVREQRSTPWMRFESLQQCLDPGDPGRTIEGHPAPVRAVVMARRN